MFDGRDDEGCELFWYASFHLVLSNSVSVFLSFKGRHTYIQGYGRCVHIGLIC